MLKHCDPVRALEDVVSRARARAAGRRDPTSHRPMSPTDDAGLPAAPRPSPVERLPDWPSTVRGAPNAVLRSALFGAVGRGEKQYLQKELLASVNGVEILYTGLRLDQVDFDLWLALIHMAKDYPAGEEIRVTAYRLLRLMGRADTGGSRGTREAIDTRITRLANATVRIRVGRYSYEGALISGSYRDEAEHHYCITLNPKLLSLFGRDQYTELDLEIRSTLIGKPLAQWLHGFSSSHASPGPISVKTLRDLCGSEAKRIAHFREKLRNALTDVQAACRLQGQVFEAEIIDDVVHVTRTPSVSQRRHLEKKGMAGDGL